MKDWDQENQKQKHQFKSSYCASCKQRKPCGALTGWDSGWKNYCCWCYYQNEQAKATGYNSYEEVLVSKQIDRERKFRQLQLLQSYRGCKECKSKKVEAYYWCEKNRLVCWVCLMKKEGGASSPVSFLEQKKWFKKRWGINLTEWLTDYRCLPTNAECASKWSEDKEHLRSCECLEVEAKESYLLFSNWLREMREKLKGCRCRESEKVRVGGDDWTWCESCDKSITVARKKRVIKNRNDPKFWGLNTQERVLCGFCLRKLVEQMPTGKKYTFRKYEKRGYWE